MKKASSILLVAGSLFILNVQRPPLADKAIITEAKIEVAAKGKKFKVNTTASTLGWTGTKPSGKHSGTINITSGNLQVAGGTVSGGTFAIDMNTIVDTDMTGKGKEGLEGHLKSADFFDVAKYPTATFVVTNTATITASQNLLLVGATHNITGNLTLRGVTKSVTFPAIITLSKKQVTAKADFNIDRTEWGMTYGADGKVDKQVNLQLSLVANK
jgi:polyisoprenoid-binding protein YceI